MKYFAIIFVLFNLFNSNSQVDSSRFYKTDKNCLIYNLYYGDDVSFNWHGGCENGYAEGKGTCFVFYDSMEIAKFEGEFIKGIGQGPFIITTHASSEYTCNLTNGRMTGKGNFKSEDGDIYSGELRDFKFHGFGELTYSKGTQSIGVFNNSMIWNGKYVTLKNDTILYHRGELVLEKPISKKINYKPKFNTELTEYFDENWNRCNKAEAVYYRKITYQSENTPMGLVKDYYISGNIAKKYYLSYVDYDFDELNFYDAGPVTTYYENGNIYSEGTINYRGVSSGLNKYFHDNGELKTLYYRNHLGELAGERIDFNNQGKLTSYANYEQDELVDGKFYDVSKDGLWTLKYIEDFEKNIDFWNSNEAYNGYMYEDFLVLNSPEDQSYFITQPMNVDFDLPFAIYLNIVNSKKKLKKNGYVGLVFDYEDNDNYNILLVNAKNQASLIQILDGQYSVIAEKQLPKMEGSDFPNFEWRILDFDESVKFMVNDIVIYEINNWNWKKSEYGIISSSDETIYIKSLCTFEYFDAEQSNKFTNYVDLKLLSPEESSSKYDGNGSGFFISRKGHLVTNFHVIENASQIDIQITNGGEVKFFKARVLVQDKINDLAILKIEGDFDLGSEIPYIIDYTSQDVGTEVFTLGYPLMDIMGSEIKFTDGKISAKSGLEGDIRLYQITTPIQPGNSGGPLFDLKGNVIGIIVSTLNRENYNAENVNFAIKSTILKNLIESSPENIPLNTKSKLSTTNLTNTIKSLDPYIPVVLIME